MVLYKKIRKWGNSYGILLAKDELVEYGIHENETITVQLDKQPNLHGLFGKFKFKKSTEKIMKEIDEGYDD
ncbi:MAG: hypothetical protein V1743_07845 [Nanoarchaeota archaeon]